MVDYEDCFSFICFFGLICRMGKQFSIIWQLIMTDWQRWPGLWVNRSNLIDERIHFLLMKPVSAISAFGLDRIPANILENTGKEPGTPFFQTLKMPDIPPLRWNCNFAAWLDFANCVQQLKLHEVWRIWSQILPSANIWSIYQLFRGTSRQSSFKNLSSILVKE